MESRRTMCDRLSASVGSMLAVIVELCGPDSCYNIHVESVLGVLPKRLARVLRVDCGLVVVEVRSYAPHCRVANTRTSAPMTEEHLAPYRNASEGRGCFFMPRFIVGTRVKMDSGAQISERGIANARKGSRTRTRVVKGVVGTC